MNGRLAKAIRKEAKIKIKNEVLFLDRAFRPKPRWLPVWAWRRLARIYFNDGYFVFEKSDKVRQAYQELKK